jgi:hypothetical protein
MMTYRTMSGAYTQIAKMRSNVLWTYSTTYLTRYESPLRIVCDIRVGYSLSTSFTFPCAHAKHNTTYSIGQIQPAISLTFSYPFIHLRVLCRISSSICVGLMTIAGQRCRSS